MLKLPLLLSRTVYSLTREVYLAGCALHIQTLTFLVLTFKQCVNAKTIWGSEVRHINRHEDYCQPLVTYVASIQLTLKVFLWRQVVLELRLHFTTGWQSSVRILPSVCILFPVCSLQCTFYTDRIVTQTESIPWFREIRQLIIIISRVENLNMIFLYALVF